MNGGRTRHRSVGQIHLGQQQGISRGKAFGKGVDRSPVAFTQGLAVHNPGQEPGELGARIAAGAQQVAQHHALVRPAQPGIAKAVCHGDDVRVAPVIAVGDGELHRQRTGQEGLELGNSLQTGFVHIDHHAGNDRPKPVAQAQTSVESRTTLQAHTSLEKD